MGMYITYKNRSFGVTLSFVGYRMFNVGEILAWWPNNYKFPINSPNSGAFSNVVQRGELLKLNWIVYTISSILYREKHSY